MEVHSSGNHSQVTSSADRLAVEQKSTSISENLSTEQPVAKGKRKRRRKRRKKPAPLAQPIHTEESDSPEPIPKDESVHPDLEQETLTEDADTVPIYHTSGRSLSRKLVSTMGSGKASDYLRSTSGGKPSDHLISTEKTTSGDLKATGKKAISNRVRMTGSGSMAAKITMEENLDDSFEESARTGFSSEKSRSKRYRFKGVRSPEMLGWEEDAPQQNRTVPFTSVSALCVASKETERRRQLQRRMLSQSRQQIVSNSVTSAPMGQKLDSSYALHSGTSAPVGQKLDSSYPLSSTSSAPMEQYSVYDSSQQQRVISTESQRCAAVQPVSSFVPTSGTGGRVTIPFAPLSVSSMEKLLRRSVRQKRIRDREAQSVLEAGQQSIMLQSSERLLHQQMVDQQEKMTHQNANAIPSGVSAELPSAVSLSQNSTLERSSKNVFHTSDRLRSGKAPQRFRISAKTSAPMEQKFQGASSMSGVTSAPMGQKSNGRNAARVRQRMLLQKQMEQRRQLQAAAPQTAINDSQEVLLPSEQHLYQQLIDAQSHRPSTHVSGQVLLRNAIRNQRSSNNYGQSLHQSDASVVQTDENTVHDSVCSASLSERVLLFGNSQQTGSEKQQNTSTSNGWRNHSHNEDGGKEHSGSPISSDGQGSGQNQRRSGWSWKAAAQMAMRSSQAANRRMEQAAQQEQDETSRQAAQFKRSTARNARLALQGAKGGTQLGRNGWKLTRKAAQKAQKAGIASVKVAVTEAVKRVAQMVTVMLTSAVSTVLTPLGVLAVILVLITTLITGVIIPSVSHYGVFLVNEQEQEISFSTALNRLSSDYFSRIYELEMEDDYEEITVECGITDSDEAWKKMISVYAVNATKQGYDAITMDADHYRLLKDVFWDTITISHHVTVTYETVVEEIEPERTEYRIHYYNADGIEVPYPVLGGTEWVETVTIPAVTETRIIEHKKLKITVRETGLNALENHYLFDSGEKDSVSEMLDEPDDVWAGISDSFPNLMISSGVGGAIGSINVEDYATVGETVYRALIAEGYTPQAACGILGNIQQECSMNPNCQSGGAYGMCQWMGGRLTNLKRLANYQTAAVQTGFMISELRSQTYIWTTFGGEVSHTYSGVRITSLSAFKSCTNVKAAAGAFCICFERPGEFPGNQWYEARLRYAQQWYSYAQSHWQ